MALLAKTAYKEFDSLHRSVILQITVGFLWIGG